MKGPGSAVHSDYPLGLMVDMAAEMVRGASAVPENGGEKTVPEVYGDCFE